MWNNFIVYRQKLALCPHISGQGTKPTGPSTTEDSSTTDGSITKTAPEDSSSEVILLLLNKLNYLVQDSWMGMTS